MRGVSPYSLRPLPPYRLNHASPQALGLAGWWPATASVSRLSLHDLSDYGSHADLTAGIGWVAVPYSADYDQEWSPEYNAGSSTGATFASAPPSLNISGDITMAAWVAIISGGGGSYHAFIYHKVSATSNETKNKELAAISGSFRFGLAKADGTWSADTLLGGPSITANRLYHVVGVGIASSQMRLYIDGVFYASKNVTWSFAAGDAAWSFGRRMAVSEDNWHLHGRIADVRIWNRALTDMEVWQLYDPATRWDLYEPFVPRIPWLYAPPAPAYVPRHGFILYNDPGMV